VDPRRLRDLLRGVEQGSVSVEQAAEALRTLPFDALGELARVDHHRELRVGSPEVVFGESKSASDIAAILRALAGGGGGGLATRVDRDKAAAVLAELPGAAYHEVARAVVVAPAEARRAGRGTIAVVAAGTSDRPVAEEAAVTLEFLGHRVARLTDVGIAGLQRVVGVAEELRRAAVCVVVAGMEGALPGVVAGLVASPVVAVPTSVGYGVGLGGFVAMLSMLTTCSPGVVVVNIDNGFGAAIAAARMNQP
jgi:pyridinium-3,5-biscarboxylic acid mononucleotide synthase